MAVRSGGRRAALRRESGDKRTPFRLAFMVAQLRAATWTLRWRSATRLKLATESELEDLLQAAAQVAASAYSPYSKLNRGAAVLSGSGKTYVGCNVEIASYAGSLCAEMGAVSAAVAAGDRKFKAIALSPPAYPCGTCRQMLVEFAPGIDIVFEENGIPRVIPLLDLLPNHFGPENLA